MCLYFLQKHRKAVCARPCAYSCARNWRDSVRGDCEESRGASFDVGGHIQTDARPRAKIKDIEGRGQVRGYVRGGRVSGMPSTSSMPASGTFWVQNGDPIGGNLSSFFQPWSLNLQTLGSCKSEDAEWSKLLQITITAFPALYSWGQSPVCDRNCAFPSARISLVI